MSEGVKLVSLAAVHEYGAPSRNIPPRPFIKPVILEVAREMVKNYQKAIEETFKV